MPRRRATSAQGLLLPTDTPCAAPPGPGRAHPESAGYLILLRRRPCSAAASAPAPARALAGAAVLPPARPRAPAAPPRRRTRPAAAAPTANHKEQGAEPAARQTRPIQPVPCACKRSWGSAGDWSGLLKELRCSGLEEKGLPPGTANYLAESQWEEQEFLSPNRLRRLPQFFTFLNFLFLQFSNRCLHQGGKPRLPKSGDFWLVRFLRIGVLGGNRTQVPQRVPET